MSYIPAWPIFTKAKASAPLAIFPLETILREPQKEKSNNNNNKCWFCKKLGNLWHPLKSCTQSPNGWVGHFNEREHPHYWTLKLKELHILQLLKCIKIWTFIARIYEHKPLRVTKCVSTIINSSSQYQQIYCSHTITAASSIWTRNGGKKWQGYTGQIQIILEHCRIWDLESAQSFPPFPPRSG